MSRKMRLGNFCVCVILKLVENLIKTIFADYRICPPVLEVVEFFDD